MGVEVDAYRAQSNALSKAFKEPPDEGSGKVRVMGGRTSPQVS